MQITMNLVAQNGKPTKSALYGFYSFMNKLNEKHPPRFVDQVIQNGIKYLESTYTINYGWITDISSSENLEQSKACVPNLFDTSLILDLLSESDVTLSPFITKRCVNWLLDEKIEEENLWNYFIRGCYLIPHEADTCTNVICCLYSLGGISREDATNLIKGLVPKLWFHEEDGIMDVYFKGDHPYVWPPWKVEERVDIGVIASTLHGLARFGLEDILNEEKFDMCFQVLDEVINDMLNGTRSEFLKNYESFDVALFIISRVVRYSGRAKKLFGKSMETLVKDQFGVDTIALQVSCRILTALNLGMIESCKDLVVDEAKVLIKGRDGEDNSWPKHAFFSAHKQVYFGSKAVTTGFAVAALKRLSDKVPNLSDMIEEKVSMIIGEQ